MSATGQVMGDATAGWKQEDIDRFVEIVKRGGVIVCSPDVYQALQREADKSSLEQLWAVGAEIRVSHVLPPCTFAAFDNKENVLSRRQRPSSEESRND